MRILVLFLLAMIVFAKYFPFIYCNYGWWIWKDLYNSVEHAFISEETDKYIMFKWNNHTEYTCVVYNMQAMPFCEIYETVTHKIVFSSYWQNHSNRLAEKLLQMKQNKDKEFINKIDKIINQ